MMSAWKWVWMSAYGPNPWIWFTLQSFGTASTEILENELSVGTHGQQKAEFWLRLNFPSPRSEFNNLSSSLVSSHNWNLSRWILFTENHCRSEVLSKSPCMKNSYKAYLFSASKLKVSPDKIQVIFEYCRWNSSHDWMISSDKKRFVPQCNNTDTQSKEVSAKPHWGHIRRSPIDLLVVSFPQ